MKTIDHFIPLLLEKNKLENKRVLEIGCGEGNKTVQISKVSGISIVGIDSDTKSISLAKKNCNRSNVRFVVGRGENLPFKKGEFDAVMFMLSLHHIRNLTKAFAEARRVVKEKGKIIVVEPGFSGTMFSAEIFFNCFDGDERMEKIKTYEALLNNKRLKEQEEFWGTTEWKFDSVTDFKKNMQPKKNVNDIKNFLERNRYILIGERRINVFRKK